MKFKIFLAVAMFFLSLSGHAEQNNSVEQAIISGLKVLIPDLEVSNIQPTPVQGLYQVMLGAEVLYVTADGRYVLNGDMYDIQQKENITEAQKSLVRREVLNSLPLDELIEFAPKKTEHTIYVFTDISCGYCRKLHKDIPVLNENGIAVRYLAYPRAGPNSTASEELQSVWCSKDRNKAMTEAKSGKQPTADACPNPVAKQYALGQKLGVRGTPAIFLENGKALPGYFPPAELLGLVKR